VHGLAVARSVGRPGVPFDVASDRMSRSDWWVNRKVLVQQAFWPADSVIYPGTKAPLVHQRARKCPSERHRGWYSLCEGLPKEPTE
jgi:hypothetical protein